MNRVNISFNFLCFKNRKKKKPITFVSISGDDIVGSSTDRLHEETPKCKMQVETESNGSKIQNKVREQRQNEEKKLKAKKRELVVNAAAESNDLTILFISLFN